jgi:hypothetical protein
MDILVHDLFLLYPQLVDTRALLSSSTFSFNCFGGADQSSYLTVSDSATTYRYSATHARTYKSVSETELKRSQRKHTLGNGCSSNPVIFFKTSILKASSLDNAAYTFTADSKRWMFDERKWAFCTKTKTFRKTSSGSPWPETTKLSIKNARKSITGIA